MKTLSPEREIHTCLGADRDDDAAPPRIAILYENPEWMQDLFVALRDRGLRYEAFDLSEPAFLPDEPRDYDLVINRVSPSAHLRGHGVAIGIARRWLGEFERRGTPVINGSSFELETSKLEQHRIIRDLGLSVPRTATLTDRRAGRGLAGDFPFPAILKPDMGGSGAGVRFVESRARLERILDEEPDLFAGGALLLQEFVFSSDGSIVRTEFVDGEMLFAMRVRPVNTFNLCPADGCERPPIDDGVAADAIFELEHDVPHDAVAQARAIVRAAGVSIGGVEYIEAVDGKRYFYDINATSAYRREIVEASGVDAMERVVVFVERKLGELAPARERQAA